MSVSAKLKDYLSSRIQELPPGVSEAEMLAFESRYGVRLPADMRSYFLLVNGTRDNWADETLVVHLKDRLET